MSIRSVLLIAFSTLIALLLALVLLAFLAARGQREVAASEHRRFESWKLADELRQSSDELTRMARTYVVTGDPAYERHFDDILAIRNGQMPRPEGYDGIYWDFIVAGDRPVAASGPAIALEQLMRDLSFTEAELAKLEEAQARSDALVQLEEVAMNAVKGRFADDAGNFTIKRAPDLERARELMHGKAYHQAKAEIMRPIGEFFELLDARTAGDVEIAHRQARRYGIATLALAAVTATLTLAMLVLLLRRVTRPINEMVGRLRDIAAGDGDLTRRVDESRRDELGELARWFNAFVQMVHDIVREVARTSGTVASAATEIAAASRSQQTTVSSLSSSTTQIAVAVKEISASGGELAGTVGEVSDVARRTASVAADGRSGLEQMGSTMQRLADATDSVSTRLSVVRDRATGINRIVTTIVKVADQTDLLSVNAAIEAEKAGEAGAGFHVVAREIRHLADQTAEATLEIELDVEQMGEAVSAGAAEMDTFGENVHQVVDRVGRVTGQLAEIIERVEALTERFGGVNEGMVQQAAGIEQINEAMVTLTANASATTGSLAEFTRTAEHLREATATLQRQVSRFKLNERSGTGIMPVPEHL